MSDYFATFVPGFKNLISQTIKKDISLAEIMQLLESSVYFSCDESLLSLEKKQYFTNIFVVEKFLRVREDQSVNSVFKGITKRSDLDKILSELANEYSFSTFRLMVQSGSKLTHIPKALRNPFVSRLSQATQLVYSPLKADLEVWVLIRDEGYAVLAVKIVKVHDANEKIEKGQLRPHMAHMLNLMSEPREPDIYLDPFAGHGALPLDRLHMPFTRMYISDIDEKLVKKLKTRFQQDNISVQQADALNLEHVDDNVIDKVVTDPPWGLFANQEVNYENFYKDMLTEMKRVTKNDGSIVILTAQTEAFEIAVNRIKGIVISNQNNTLVNGKKATAYKLDVTK